MAKTDTARLALAKARFKLCEEVDHDQRAQEQSDLQFYNGDQWDPLVAAARGGQPANTVAGLPPVPARPTYVVNKVKEPVRQVLNQERQADFGIELVAADDFGGLTEPDPKNEDEIELREGLVRRIQRESEAADARTWAFDRAVKAGRGFYAVMTRYVHGKSFDKEIYIHRFYNQATVYLDPAHEQPDGSDARYAFIGVDMPLEKYEAEFGKNRVSRATTDADWRGLMDDAPGWFKTDGEVRAVRVVDYFYTVDESRTLCLFADGSTAWKDELADSQSPIDEREVVEQTIKWCKIDGVQILDETDWEGPDLPIVKVLGEEVQPYDQKRRANGMVRSARDSQMGFNSMVSKLVEMVGLAPLPPFQAAEGTWEKYAAFYQQANTRTIPVLPYSPYDLRDNPAPMPTRTDVNVPIQPIAVSIQMFDESIQSTTGVGDPQLGKTDPSVKSGRAIDLLRKQSQQGTSHFLDNLRRSIRYEGQIINNLLYPIYGTRPGRLARIVTGEGESQTIVIAPPQQPGAPPAPQPSQKTYTLTPDAQFNVIVKVTRSYDSRREEESDIISQLLNANPEFITWFGDLFFKYQDGPGHDAMAERAKVMLAPPIQQLLTSKESGQPQIPPPVMAQMTQLQQRLKDAEALLQKAAGELQSNQAEMASKEKIAALDRQADIEKVRMQNATAIEVKKLDLLSKGIVAEGQAQDEQIALHTELAHDAAQAHLDRTHQADLAQQAQQHAAATGAVDAGMAAESGAAQRAHEAEQADLTRQAAAEQTESTDGN